MTADPSPAPTEATDRLSAATAAHLRALILDLEATYYADVPAAVIPLMDAVDDLIVRTNGGQWSAARGDR